MKTNVKEIDALMDIIVLNLCNNKINQAAEGLMYFAHKCAEAGFCQEEFSKIRRGLVRTAVLKSKHPFMLEKLKAEESKLNERSKSNGRKNITSEKNLH